LILLIDEIVAQHQAWNIVQQTRGGIGKRLKYSHFLSCGYIDVGDEHRHQHHEVTKNDSSRMIKNL